VFRVGDGAARTEDFIFKLIEDEDTALLVAETGEEVVGLVHVVTRAASDFSCVVPRRYANVESLAVRAGSRRQGIGSALMEEARRWAAGKGLAGIELTVWEFNTGALALYEELGYTTASRKLWRPV
jgi:ribosomal protein S18 acetylase RimI-like enzyme